MVLKSKKFNIDNKIKLSFHVTPQSPPSIKENRKKLFEVSAKYIAKVLPNDITYHDKVSVSNVKDIMKFDGKEREKLENIKLIFITFLLC